MVIAIAIGILLALGVVTLFLTLSEQENVKRFEGALKEIDDRVRRMEGGNFEIKLN